MIPWLEEFQSMLQTEWYGTPWIATLATVDAQGHPDARSIVLRRIDRDGTIWIASDSRSAKHEQLKRNDAAAIVVYLPKRRVQFRLRGMCSQATADEEGSACYDVWKVMSAEARALYFGPVPGTPRVEGEPVSPVANPTAMPDHFEVIEFRTWQVEMLDLTTSPHTRVRYVDGDDGWSKHLLNP